MKALDTLLDIHTSFSYFQQDFSTKEENQALKIYYVMDNDVFSLALFPFDKKIKYADLFNEYHPNSISKDLEVYAKQLALTIRELSSRGSIYVMPSHRLEYKKTLYYYYGQLDNIKKSIDEEALKKEFEGIQKDLKTYFKKFENDNKEFRNSLKDVAPKLFRLIYSHSKYEFLIGQLKEFTKTEKRLGHFEDLLDKTDETLVFKNASGIDIEDSLKSKMIHKKSPFALANDVKAFKTLLAFNKKYIESKKLILFTGDRSLLATYEDYEEALDIEDGFIRHPKYLIPFIFSPNNTLYCDKNKSMLNNIDTLFDNFLTGMNDGDIVNLDISRGVFSKSANDVIKNLKSILNVNSYAESDRYLNGNTSDFKDEKEFIKQLYRQKDFTSYIDNIYNELLNEFKATVSISSAIYEILSHKKELKKKKAFGRFPFVLCLENDDEQKVYRNLIDYMTKEQEINDSIFTIDETFPLYTVFSIVATIMLYVDKTQKAEYYIKLAQKEISKIDSLNDMQCYIKNEISLLNLYYIRGKSNTIEEYESAKKQFDDVLKHKGMSKGQKLRIQLGKCALEISFLYFSFFELDKNKKTQSPNVIYEILKDLNQNLKDLPTTKPLIRIRASIQINMSIASLYIFKKYFLEEDSTEIKSYIQENMEIYDNLLRDNRNISIRKIILNFLFWDFGKKTANTISFFLNKELDENENLLIYERERLRYLLEKIS